MAPNSLLEPTEWEEIEDRYKINTLVGWRTDPSIPALFICPRGIPGTQQQNVNLFPLFVEWIPQDDTEDVVGDGKGLRKHVPRSRAG